MKVLIVFEYATISGGENSILAAMSAMRTTHPSLELVAATPGSGPLTGRLDSIGIQATTLAFHDESGQRLPRERVIMELTALTDMLSVDLVHGNSLSMARLLGAARRFITGNTTSHIRDIVNLSSTASADVGKNSGLIAVSEATKRHHVTVNGINSDIIRVIHNGIESQRLEDQEPVRTAARQQLRQQLGIPPESFVILSVGQICLRKGLDSLASALIRVTESIGQFHFVYAGERYSSKNESIQFESEFFRRFEESDRIVLHRLGFRDDVQELMYACDILVHAARQEPFGRVLLEACSYGLPIIATDVGGTREMLTNKESAGDADCGILVSVDDPDLIAEAITRIHQTPELRDKLARQANQNCLRRFSLRNHAEALAEFWEECAMGQ